MADKQPKSSSLADREQDGENRDVLWNMFYDCLEILGSETMRFFLNNFGRSPSDQLINLRRTLASHLAAADGLDINAVGQDAISELVEGAITDEDFRQSLIERHRSITREEEAMEPLLDVKAAAQEIGVSPSTLRVWISLDKRSERADDLPFRETKFNRGRKWLVDRDDLMEWHRKRKASGGA